MSTPGKVAVVAVAASDQVLAFSATSGVWVAHSAAVLTNADKVDARVRFGGQFQAQHKLLPIPAA